MLSSIAGTQLPASRLRPNFAVHAIAGRRAGYRQQRLGMMCMAKGRDMSAQAAAVRPVFARSVTIRQQLYADW